MQYLKIILAFIISIASAGIHAQNYKFRSFGTEQGITHPYIYTIAQDRRGYLWAGTAEGLCRFDGVNVETFSGFNKAAGNFITTSCTDSKGNIWFGHNEGGVTLYDGKSFKPVSTEQNFQSPITGIAEDLNGNIWFASQNDGLMMISNDNDPAFYKAGFTDPIYAIAITSRGEMLTGTGTGINIYELKPDGARPSLLGGINGIDTKVQCLTRRSGTNNYWAGTEDQGLYAVTPESSKGMYGAQQLEQFDIKEENIQSIYEDSEHNLWLPTFGSGIYKLVHGKGSKEHSGIIHFNDNNGLGSKYVKAIFQDREGNMWIGTYGAGLAILQDNYFTFYSTGNGAASNVLSLITEKAGNWFGVGNGLLYLDQQGGQGRFIPCKGLPEDNITAITTMANGTFWIGTEHSGLYRADSTLRCKRVPLSDDHLSSYINAIASQGSSLWVATKAGIFHLDGEEMQHYTTTNGLTHNSVNHICAGKKGELWIATQSNYLSLLKDGKVINYPVAPAGGVLNIVSIAEDKSGNTWFATQGNGILQFIPGRNSINNYTTDNGLRSNYCYSIAVDGENKVWIGHRNGLSRINPKDNSIKAFGAADGITGECNLNAMSCDNAGNLWIGTTNGIVKYDPAKDRKNLVPPVLNITSVKFSDKDIDPSSDIELPYDIYKLRVEFSGLTFREPERVRYQYKLEGHDIDWSEPAAAGYAIYNRLADGEYTFLVRAFNSDGVFNKEPQKLRIMILSPIWKRWWFILLSVFTGGYALFFVLGVREKRMKMFQQHLQRMLDQRTHEVVKQKEQLEHKNKDITDSINYAKRIQDAILPDISSLKSAVSESFVLYKPRDIVSGDFYWFERVGDKLLVACADSTGHGVPGALMSMIGSTLLKELCVRREINSPADILNALDKELCKVLKKHEGTTAQDSMDIIICEIDLATHTLRIASAMRPAILYRNGQPFIFRKKQHLIGSADSVHTPFEDTEIQLQKGDCIYLFTDGYPDQFGGDKGKKLKTERFKELIHSMHHLPMDGQQKELDQHFNEWKQEQQQVDDVLVIGIRI